MVTFDLLEEKPENTEFRLQRKDTPHFTKGKRIVQSDEQKAREILANLEAKEASDDDHSDLDDQKVIKHSVFSNFNQVCVCIHVQLIHSYKAENCNYGSDFLMQADL